jgi:hypothetical protein
MAEPLHPSRDLHDLPVYDSAQIPIGKTFGVLTEPDSGLVRFFDVALDGRARHVLIPVGHARMEKHLGAMRLRLRVATVNELERIPAYEPHIAWQEDRFQNELLDSFGRLFEGQRYYAHPAYDHTGLYAGTHPILRESLAPVAVSGLRRLSDMAGFRVADGEQDVRQWDLLGDHVARLGRVTDLVIDPDAQQVRYLVVRREVDDRETALPIGYAELGADSVHCALTPDDMLTLPEFSGADLTRDDEVAIRLALDARLRGKRLYLRPDFRSAA